MKPEIPIRRQEIMMRDDDLRDDNGGGRAWKKDLGEEGIAHKDPRRSPGSMRERGSVRNSGSSSGRRFGSWHNTKVKILPSAGGEAIKPTRGGRSRW